MLYRIYRFSCSIIWHFCYLQLSLYVLRIVVFLLNPPIRFNKKDIISKGNYLAPRRQVRKGEGNKERIMYFEYKIRNTIFR